MATAVQADGKTIIAGSFSSVLGVPRANIARLNADGTLDTGFDPKTNGWGYSLAVQADGKVLLAGSFITVQPNGAGAATSRWRIARVNGDGSLDAGFDPRVNGDIFMRNIEQIAAYIPYMTSVGNHENGASALAHYTESFRNMPSNSGSIASANGLSRNNWWYSWNAGLVHYVAISTELYFGVGPSDACSQQFAFLKADLAKANRNRDKQPWIVVHGHRSIYCSCDGDCDGSATTVRDGIPGKCGGLEELIFKNGVDFFLNGAFVPPAAHDLARSGSTAHSRLWEREDLVSYVHLSIGLVLMSHRWLTP